MHFPFIWSKEITQSKSFIFKLENTLLQKRLLSFSLGLIVEDDVFASDTPDEQKISKYSVDFVQNQPSPRFIKSHFPLDLLPTVIKNNCKVSMCACTYMCVEKCNLKRIFSKMLFSLLDHLRGEKSKRCGDLVVLFSEGHQTNPIPRNFRAVMY